MPFLSSYAILVGFQGSKNTFFLLCYLLAAIELEPQEIDFFPHVLFVHGKDKSKLQTTALTKLKEDTSSLEKLHKLIFLDCDFAKTWSLSSLFQ